MHVPSSSPVNHSHLGCIDAVCHSDELFYVFHSSEFVNATYTPEESQLSFDMLLYWTSFARGESKPNSKLIEWPKYSNPSNQSIAFDIPIYTLSNYNEQKVRYFYLVNILVSNICLVQFLGFPWIL